MVTESTTIAIKFHTLRTVVVIVFLLLSWTEKARPQENLWADLEIDRLQRRLDQIRRRVGELAGEEDLMDTLHFAWFDRPFARATLAVLVKTVDTLQRELGLRKRDKSAISNATIDEMFTWAEGAIERVVTSKPMADFRPHRLRVNLTDSSADVPPLFALIDRATRTRRHDLYGDLDLLAALGQRVYPRWSNHLWDSESFIKLHARANDLGMQVITLLPPGQDLSHRPTNSSEAKPLTLSIQPVTLRFLLESSTPLPHQSHVPPVILDTVSSESWPAALARRALVRGISGNDRYIVVGWNAPDTGESALAAAMWVHAAEGQMLGLIPGWRDRRDGSGSPYPDLFTRPARLETIAHTSLDLLRYHTSIASSIDTPLLAIAVHSDVVAGENENAWAEWALTIWNELFARQIRYDLVVDRSRNERLAQRYRVVFPLHRNDVGDVQSVLLRIEQAMSMYPAYSDRMTLQERNGSLAEKVYIRQMMTTQGGPRILVVNLSDQTRRLKLYGRLQHRTWFDLQTKERLSHPGRRITLKPWQVRWLGPALKRNSG